VNRTQYFYALGHWQLLLVAVRLNVPTYSLKRMPRLIDKNWQAKIQCSDPQEMLWFRVSFGKYPVETYHMSGSRIEWWRMARPSDRGADSNSDVDGIQALGAAIEEATNLLAQPLQMIKNYIPPESTAIAASQGLCVIGR
jgi:hypothetical protein